MGLTHYMVTPGVNYPILDHDMGILTITHHFDPLKHLNHPEITFGIEYRHNYSNLSGARRGVTDYMVNYPIFGPRLGYFDNYSPF